MKRFISLFLILVLTLSLVPAVAAANEILPVNTLITGQFSSADAVVEYSTTLTEAGSIRLRAYGADCRLQLFSVDEYGTTEPVFSTVTMNSSNHQTAKYRVPAGTYLVRMTATTAGEYQVIFYHNIEPADQYEQEPNGTFPYATPLSADVSVKGNSQEILDLDYFSLTLPYPASIQISMSLPENCRFYVQILTPDENGTPIQVQRTSFSSVSGVSEPLALSAGTRYLCVYSSTDTALYTNDDYTLRYSLVHQPTLWAQAEITQASALGLIPASIEGLYQNAITRAEFCTAVINLLTTYTGMDVDQLLSQKGVEIDPDHFTDTTDPIVLAANALGIVNGRSEVLFVPDATIRRQEAAVMLYRTASVMGITEPNAEPMTFNDGVDSWALEAVDFISAMDDPTSGNRVMGGTGVNRFSPLGNYTRETSLVTLLRLYNAMKDIQGS